MSEGSSRLPPRRLKRKRPEKRYRSITSERNIVPDAIIALDAHRKSVRLMRQLLKDIENEMVVEKNSLFLEDMTVIVTRDMKVLKNLMLRKFGWQKDMKKMTKLNVEGEGEEEDQEHDGEEGGEAKPEEEEGESSDDASSDTDDEAFMPTQSDDGSNCCPSGEDKVDYVKWARYYKQIHESEGFDIDDVPGVCMSAHIVPLRNVEKDRKQFLKVINLATKALNAFNLEKGKRYKFLKLVSVNSQLVAGLMYFVTFEARNPEDGYATTFQTKIYWRGPEGEEVQFCRIKKS